VGTHSLESTEGETGQNSKRKREGNGHSLSGEHRWRLVRKVQESKGARDTHFLECRRDESGQRKKAREEWALTPWRAQMETSQESEKKVRELGTPTFWRVQEGQVRAQKESEGVMGTHNLESTEGGSGQDSEKK